jgi:PAS domain S-box-containing protein
MIQFSLARKLKIAFYISMLFTAAVLYTMYINMRKTVIESSNTNFAITALLQSENILSNLQAAEIGKHGYYKSGKESFLIGHKNAVYNMEAGLVALEKLPLHEPSAKSTIEDIKNLVKTIKVKENPNFDGYDAATINDIEATEKINSTKITELVNSINEKEKSFLQKPTSEKEKYNDRLTRSFIVLGLLFLLILVNGYMLIMRDFKKSELMNSTLQYNTTLLNNISDAIIATDENFLIKDWNKYAEELYGYKAAEVKGKKITDVIQLQVSDKENFFDITKKQKIWKGEMQHTHKNGYSINVEVSTSAIYNSKGVYVGAIGIIHDISKRVEMEEQLKMLSIKLQKEVNLKSNDLDNFFERIADSFFILDNNWNYTYLNKNAIELHKEKEEKMLGNNIWEIFPELVKSDFYTALNKAKNTQLPVRGEFYYVKEDKWFEDLIYPNKDGLSIYYHDITGKKKAALELANAEAKFRSLVEQSMVGVYIRRDEKIIYVNPRFAEIFGYTEKEIYDNPNSVFLVTNEEIGIVKKNVDDYKTGKIVSHNYEVKGKHKTGKIVYVELFGTLTNYDGKDAVIGTAIDITERKIAAEQFTKATEALKISNDRFELVGKATKDAIWDWDMNTDELKGNEIFCGLFNKPANTIFKFADFLDRVHEEDQILLKKNFENALEKKESLLLEEFRFTTSSGQNRIMNDRAYIMYKDGTSYRMLGAMQDITTVKEAEEALITSEQKYKLLFNENPLPMWILLEETGRFIDANTSATNYYGYTKEEFIKMPIMDLHPKNDIAYEEWNKKSEKEKQQTEMKWEHQKKDGTIVKVHIISNRIVYQGKNATLALANDITETYLAEENLQKSKQAFKELAAHLETIRENERTHMAREIHDELGQQLTGLKMDISWINKKVKSDDTMVQQKMRDTIELIDKTVITVRRIATQLRPSILDDLGLVEAMEWQSEEFERRSEIKSIFKTNMNHVKVSEEIATGVFRIFQESLTNVSRHSKASEVNTVFKIEDNLLTLSIEDNGVGFKEDTIKNKKTLGLLGMRERVSLINGTYNINGNTGLGTTVLITVPLL